MKTRILQAGGAAVALAFTQIANAVQINGNIGFTGGATVDTSSMGTATEVTSWVSPTVTLDSGNFSSIALNTPVTINSPWTFASGSIPDFWVVGGFTFTLLSSVVVQQGFSTSGLGFVAVDGMGMVSSMGYTPTPMTWNFTSQDPKVGTGPDTWTFSASGASVPDAASSAVLLGFALTGLTLVRKKLAA